MPAIKAIEPRIDVRDVLRSVRFYEEVLGFKINVLWPESLPGFAILSRDGIRLQLSASATPSRGEAGSLWFDVADIAALYATIKDQVDIEWGPEVFFYQRREFAFRDPDGHLIILSEITADPPTCTDG